MLAMLAPLAGTAGAQQISQNQAYQSAMGFVQRQDVRRAAGRGAGGAASASKELKLVHTQRGAADRGVSYYVFNRGNDEGFVIVSGDASAQEILCYCDKGSFDADQMPENFKWWLSQLEQQITDGMTYGMTEEAMQEQAAHRAAVSSRSSVDQLLTTEWDQSAPYWNDIPLLGSGYNHFVTGCVATAMAQVMNYHQYPAQGTGKHSYSNMYVTDGADAYVDSKKGTISKSFSSNFSQHTYKWNAMTDTYTEDATGEAATEVAKLMYDCGVSVNMAYGTAAMGGSSASASRLPYALSTYFGYDKSARYHVRDYYTTEEWDAMLYEELSQRRPVLYGGQSEDGGHEFVCDGYDAETDMYHFNWGWSGHYNCYTPLTGSKAIRPGGTGTGGAGAQAAYNSFQEIVLGVTKNHGGVERANLLQYDYYDESNYYMKDNNGNVVSNYDYTNKVSRNLTLVATIWNMSASLTSFKLGVKATDQLTGKTCIWPDVATCSRSYSYLGIDELSFDLSQLTYNGVYEITPIARPATSTSDDDWTDVKVKKIHELPTVTVSCGAATEPQDVVFSLSDTEVQVDRTLQIGHSETYTGQMTFTSSNPAVATVDEEGVITGVSVGRATITIQGAAMMLGEYTYYNGASASFDIEVKPLIKDTPVATLDASVLSTGETLQIALTSGYDGMAEFASSDVNVATVDANGLITAVGPGTSTITATLNASTLWEGAQFSFDISVVGSTSYLTYAPYFANDNNPYAGDKDLHYCVTNSGDAQTLYFLVDLFTVAADGTEDYIGYAGRVLNMPADYVYAETLSLNNFSGVNFVENENYRMKFYCQTDWTTHWNIPSIDFVYRATAEINYSVTSAGIGTLILPFDAEIPNDWKAYNCPGVRADGTLVMTAATSLKRNTPYILMGDAASCTFVGPNAIDETCYTVGKLRGALTSDVNFVAGDYVLQNHSGEVAFYAFDPEHPNPNNGKYTANRACLHLDLQNDDLQSFSIDPSLTSISTISDEVAGRPAGIYGLDGIRRAELQPGMNIVVGSDGRVTKCYLKK